MKFLHLLLEEVKHLIEDGFLAEEHVRREAEALWDQIHTHARDQHCEIMRYADDGGPHVE